MSKKKGLRLSLSRTTVRTLSPENLGAARGGSLYASDVCPIQTSACQTAICLTAECGSLNTLTQGGNSANTCSWFCD
jgi:hypothetical protein